MYYVRYLWLTCLLYKISKHHFLFLKVFGVQSVSNKVPDFLAKKLYLVLSKQQNPAEGGRARTRFHELRYLRLIHSSVTR